MAVDGQRMKAVFSLPRSVRWVSGELYILDQTQIPSHIVEERQQSLEQVWDSIKRLKVRGAPAIGIAGAYGLLLGLKDMTGLSADRFIAELERRADFLNTARPTAVNLEWALTRMVRSARELKGKDSTIIYNHLVEEALQIHDEDKKLCRRIGEHGAKLIDDGMGILTHCNAGALAVSELGTALAPIYIAHGRGIRIRVYVGETRPLLQGSRLTTWELQQAGIGVTLICDNMAAHIISQGLVNLIIVGADRVAANGDVANKIGTMGLAIISRHFSIPFYVACPYSTVDFFTPKGSEIIIEEREDAEVAYCGSCRIAPEGILVRNPAFDITPNELITGLITERGIISPPYDSNLRKAFEEKAMKG